MDETERREWRHFLKRLWLFILPFLLILAGPLWIFYSSGELTPLAKIIEKQKNSSCPILVGFAYSNPAPYYKLTVVKSRRPEILALGASRIMQFREQLFTPTTTFFNAGGAINKLGSFRAFLEHLPMGYQPKVIIVGLEQVFFNAAWENLGIDVSDNQLEYFERPENIFMNEWKKSYLDFFKQKFTLKNISSDTGKIFKIGLNARVNGGGFRNDGSYKYETITKGPKQESNQNKHLPLGIELANIGKFGLGHFLPATDINPTALVELDRFLDAAQKRDIQIIGFLPPYALSTYHQLVASKELYSYLFKLPDALQSVFKKYNFSFYNFSDPASFGSSDDEMIDYLHGSEKTYLRLFIKMTETDPVLRKFTDPIFLKKRLLESTDNYQIFNDELLSAQCQDMST